MRKSVGLRWVLRLATGRALPALLATACASAAAPHVATQPAPTAVRPAPKAEQTPAPADDPSTELPPHLTAEHISPVIAAAAALVKRHCWQPALDARAPDAPLSARVLLQTEIDSSGKVTSIRTDEAPPAYPQLADCAATVVRSLSFHRALGPTVVNIPFVFDAKAPAAPDSSG